MDDGKKLKDPDCSDAACCFYIIMWGDFLKNTGFRPRPKLVCHAEKPKVKCPSEVPKKYVQGDWMCSVWTTLKRGLELTYENKNAGKKLWEQEPYMSSLSSTKGVTKRTYAEILNHFEDFREVLENATLQEFIKSAYTFANLIIVPDGFNVARSRPTDDYWDETLKRYFNNRKPLKRKPKNGDEIDFGTPFRKLVEKSRNGSDSLFLDEWLDKDNKSIPLPNKEPTTLDEWHDLVREMTRRIDNRREQMRDELMKR